MAVNDLTFNQLSTVLNEIVNAATGQTFTAPIDSASFISQAQTALKTGYDPLSTAISQVMSRTIFDERAYYGHFKGLMVSGERFGNMTRKLNISDSEWENDNRFELTDGQSIDMYIVKKPKILQTNFYGSNLYSDFVTIYKDQLDCAFNSADEFGRFISMVLSNINDRRVQAKENLNRSVIANLMAAIKEIGHTDQNVHLITAFNNISGESLTPTSVFAPENYKPFIEWAASYVAQISGMMTERSLKYQQNLTGYKVMHHTPLERQKMYMSASVDFAMTSRVLADAFHENYVRFADHEAVNFWQDIEDPNTIIAKCNYTDVDGSVKESSGTTIENVFGVIFDEMAAGVTTVNEWSMPTPMNANGGYTNHFYHFTDRYFNDVTEKAVLFTLD